MRESPLQTVPHGLRVSAMYLSLVCESVESLVISRIYLYTLCNARQFIRHMRDSLGDHIMYHRLITTTDT